MPKNFSGTDLCPKTFMDTAQGNCEMNVLDRLGDAVMEGKLVY